MIDRPRSPNAFVPQPVRPKNTGAGRRVRQILRRMARERGYTHEARVLDACCLADRPSWMGAARLSTRPEDHAGIDVVVESDVGKLFVQVKSSLAGRAHFERRRRKARIVVIVVGGGESPQELLRRVLVPLAELRAEYLQERHRERCAPKKSVPPKNAVVANSDWVGLRDLLLAVLLSPNTAPAASDDDLRAAMAARSGRDEGAALPAFTVRDVVARYPALFSRTAHGSVVPALDRVGAYQLRLTRLWDPPPREVLRDVLALLPAILRDQPVVGHVLPLLLAASNGGLSEGQARRVLDLVRRVGGWRPGPCTDKGGPRVVAKTWLLDPAQAESALDRAAEAVMGPFLPVDSAAFAAALGQTPACPSVSREKVAAESRQRPQVSV